MLNRRSLLISVPALALAGCVNGHETRPPTRTRDIWGPGETAPSASVVMGSPNVLVFTDGPKIPLNREAFLTLWEGPTFWMTYGAGRASRRYQADGMAMRAADGTMKLLLLTLAFAPERLAHQDGGWRLKQQEIGNYVRGVLTLPGQPSAAMTDARLGFGNLDTAFASQQMAMASLGPGGLADAPALPVDLVGDHRIDSFSSYMVKKKDVDLAYVRKFARIDTLGAAISR